MNMSTEDRDRHGDGGGEDAEKKAQSFLFLDPSFIETSLTTALMGVPSGN